jgi:hypothetical protein
MKWHLTWANVRHVPPLPAARAPGTPQNPARPTPADLSALAGNDHQERVSARALRGPSGHQTRWPASAAAGAATRVKQSQGSI